MVWAAELRQIDGDAAAALVRWGVFETTSEALRFAASDRAIAALDALIAQWSAAGGTAQRDLLRARFDRMVALRDRVGVADVLAEYDDLVRQGVDIPGYTLVATADAYLYLRQPEKARDLYLRGLAVDASNPETQLALFYAYVDLENFDAAYRQADTAAANQAIWRYLKGLNDPIENPDRATADLAAANARVYADELAEAYRRISAMADAAPNNTRYLSSLANVESARGWPRLAAEEYDISRALVPRNVTTEVGQATNDLPTEARRRQTSKRPIDV